MAGRKLLLGGFMGAGKSTVGRVVAARAGAAFVDLDAAIEARDGRPIREIFRAHGEGAFRELEADTLAEVLADPEASVVALGGGALLDATRRRRALEVAQVVTLTASAEQLAHRLAPTVARRPVLAGPTALPVRIAELLRLRADAYAECHAAVDTSLLTPDEVATAVLAAWAAPRVVVPLGGRTYTVRFGAVQALLPDALTPLRASSVALVTDANVAPSWAPSVEAVLGGVAQRVTLAPGETEKRLVHVERALEELIAAGVDRSGVVVALGGGVVSDMAGFAASILLRGVRWISVPTTLLAMVDASVGGKTGVDIGRAKNAAGTFHQPAAVVVDAAFVGTQAERDYVSGLAEVVKTAALGDAALFDLLEREVAGVRARDGQLVSEITRRSVAVKAAIVGRDEHELGERALLNFGHTLGHALEADGGFDLFTHGEAVALGMVAALHVGVARGITDPALPARVTRLLHILGLPTALEPERVGRAVGLLGLDKKRRGSAIRAVFVQELGSAEAVSVAVGDLAQAFLDAANFAVSHGPPVS